MTTKSQLPIDILQGLGACHDAIAWVRDGKFPSLQDAWDKCERGNWMLWYAGKLSGPPESEGRKRIVLATCECARLALPIFEKRHPDDKRVRVCLETAEKWARGEDGVTIEDVRKARYAAAYAAYAADAAADAAAYAARKDTLLKCAVIVRKWYPRLPRHEARMHAPRI